MACRLKVLISPRAGKNEVIGFLGDELKIRISAPPVGGAANAGLTEYLAGLLKISRKDVSIVAGQTGRRKIVKIEGLDEETALRLLAGEL